MANEATIVNKIGNQGDVVDFTVSDGTAITKGALMVVSDPRTAATSGNSASGRFVGIASSDKAASDGTVNMGLLTNVIADLVTVTTPGLEGAIQVGDLVELSGINLIRRLSGTPTFDTMATVVGQALETAGSAERIEVRVRK